VSFSVGDKVVYPHHGAAVIERMEERELFGEKRNYFILKLAYGELTLMVPTDSTEDVGLREVTPAKDMPKVFKVLKKQEPMTNTTNWSRRFKANVEKLRSGDIYQVADVVRSLHQRDKEKGLSAGEKRMLTKARQILVSELTFSKDCDEEAAEKMLDEVLG
jgi:CarD family transcriptional regulator